MHVSISSDPKPPSSAFPFSSFSFHLLAFFHLPLSPIMASQDNLYDRSTRNDGSMNAPPPLSTVRASKRVRRTPSNLTPAPTVKKKVKEIDVSAFGDHFSAESSQPSTGHSTVAVFLQSTSPRLLCFAVLPDAYLLPDVLTPHRNLCYDCRFGSKHLLMVRTFSPLIHRAAS
jgi:hypothetical protein